MGRQTRQVRRTIRRSSGRKPGQRTDRHFSASHFASEIVAPGSRAYKLRPRPLHRGMQTSLVDAQRCASSGVRREAASLDLCTALLFPGIVTLQAMPAQADQVAPGTHELVVLQGAGAGPSRVCVGLPAARLTLDGCSSSTTARAWDSPPHPQRRMLTALTRRVLNRARRSVLAMLDQSARPVTTSAAAAPSESTRPAAPNA